MILNRFKLHTQMVVVEISQDTNGTVYFTIKVDHNTIKLARLLQEHLELRLISQELELVSHTLSVAFDGVNTKFVATHSGGKKHSDKTGSVVLIT